MIECIVNKIVYYAYVSQVLLEDASTGQTHLDNMH